MVRMETSYRAVRISRRAAQQGGTDDPDKERRKGEGGASTSGGTKPGTRPWKPKFPIPERAMDMSPEQLKEMRQQPCHCHPKGHCNVGGNCLHGHTGSAAAAAQTMGKDKQERKTRGGLHLRKDSRQRAGRRLNRTFASIARRLGTLPGDAERRRRRAEPRRNGTRATRRRMGISRPLRLRRFRRPARRTIMSVRERKGKTTRRRNDHDLRVPTERREGRSRRRGSVTTHSLMWPQRRPRNSTTCRRTPLRNRTSICARSTRERCRSAFCVAYKS